MTFDYDYGDDYGDLKAKSLGDKDDIPFGVYKPGIVEDKFLQKQDNVAQVRKRSAY